MEDIIKKLKKEFLNTKDIEIAIFKVRELGKDGYAVYMNDTRLSDFLSLPYNAESFFKTFISALKKLKEQKGWKNLVWEQDEINLSSSIWRSNYITYPKRIMVLEKPCTEFTKLINYIKKYTNKQISFEEIYKVNISGKRGRVYGEDGERFYLAHSPKFCNNILDVLKKNRGSKDKMLISEKITFDDIDSLDLQYSIRNETEFYGMREQKYKITIITPSGKQKAVVNIGF